MTWWNILGIATFFLYMLPWFVLHGWMIFTSAEGVGGWDDEITPWVFIFGVVPFLNLYLATVFFIMPLWYKFKYRNDL